MLIMLVDDSGKSATCWRYFELVPTAAQLEMVASRLGMDYTTEVCVVVVNGDHDALHRLFDRELQPLLTTDKTTERGQQVRLSVVRNQPDTDGG